MTKIRILISMAMLVPLGLMAQSGSSGRGQSRGTGPLIPKVTPYKSQVHGTALEAPIIAAEYDVGPGDVFLVSVVGVEVYVFEATVTPARKLMLPQVGSFDVAGLSAAEVSALVLKKIAEIHPTYDADCILYGIREIVISLSGAVNNPGMYNVTPMVRLLTLIKLGGNSISTAALHRIEIHSNEGLKIVDLHRYLIDGDISHNPRLRQGDKVVVPHGNMESELVSVRGMNVTPLYLALRPGETAADLLNRWYATSSKSDLSSIEIHRRDASGVLIKHHYTLDEYGDVLLQPGDIVYVKPFADVAVVGEVLRPGRYPFQPGLTVAQYLTYAGGVTSSGSRGGVKIERENGKPKNSPKTEVEQGDVITVPRSTRTIWVGQTGLVQVLIAIFNISLTFLAASR